MITKEQKTARLKGIGGSDVAAILGISKWQTAHGLYLEKRGEVPDEDREGSEILEFGSKLELVIAETFAERNNFAVRKRHQHFQHKEYPFLMANIDRSIDGQQSVLECKTAGQFMVSEWGPSGSDEFPDAYRLQLQHYMTVMGYPTGYLAVLIGGNQYRQYYLEHDAELADMMIKACVEFWGRVEDGDPPDLDFSHRTTDALLKRIYPGTNGEQIDLPDDIQPWHDVMVQAKARIKEDDAVVSACKNRISAAVGDNAIGVLPSRVEQYKRSQVNVKEHTVGANSYMAMRPSKYKGE